MRLKLLIALLVVVPGLALVGLAASSIQAEERLLAERMEVRRGELARSVTDAVRAQVVGRLAAASARLDDLARRGDDPSALLSLDAGALALRADLELVAPAPTWSSNGPDLPPPPVELLPALRLEAQRAPDQALAALDGLAPDVQADPAACALRARALRAAGRRADALAVDQALAARPDAPAVTRWLALERTLESQLSARQALERLLAEGGRGGSAGGHWAALSRVAALAGEQVAAVTSLAPALCRARAAADLDLLSPADADRGEQLAPGAVVRLLRAGPAAGGDGWLVLGPPGDGPPRLRAALVVPRPELTALVAALGRERAGADADELVPSLVTAGDVALGAGLGVSVALRETALGKDIARRRALQRGSLLVGLLFVIATGSVLGWRALARTAELARLRADFVASVTHELRTPVASIRAMAEVLALGRLEPASQAEYFRGISSEAQRLGRRIEDVLDASRLEHGAFLSRPEPVDVAAVAASVVESQAAAATAAGVRLVLDAPPGDLPPARVDPGLLERALENLLENAQKHGRPPEDDQDPGRREVRVTVTSAEDALLVTVADRGPGIPPDEVGRVFERYFRGRGAKDRPGAGLGLAIVDAIARTHGGRVTVASTPGAGAAFTLSLPRWKEPTA